MIRGVILDVDGVIIGRKPGVNSPYPHPRVLARLRDIEAKGVPISLCTARPYFSIHEIVAGAGLHNLHIVEGGGVVIDSSTDTVADIHAIETDVAQLLIQTIIAHNSYAEFYTPTTYFAQADQESEPTDIHVQFLHRKAELVASLSEETAKQDVVRIMCISPNKAAMIEMQQALKPYEDQVTMIWQAHSIAPPYEFCVITAPGISKAQAAARIARHNNMELDSILGVGDSASDWAFMKDCGYVAAMGNASPELKESVNEREERSYVGPSVDEHGILDILDHFGL